MKRWIWLALLAGCDDGDGGSAVTDALVLPDTAVAADMAVDAAPVDMALPDAAADMGGLIDLPVPRITTLTAWLNRVDGGFGFIVEGQDPQDDVLAFSIEVYDAQNQLIQLDEDGGAVDVLFDNLRQGLGQFRGQFSLSFDVDGRFATMSRVRIGVLDRAENRSALMEPTFMDTPEVGRDETCDPNRGLSRCLPGDLCGTLAGGRFSCQPQEVECPAFFMAIDLNAQPDFTFTGDTSNTGSHARGHCGGGAGDQVFRFVPPVAGRYILAVEPTQPGGDPLLYVRTHCRFPDVSAELGCSDDSSAMNLSPRLVLELAADTPIFLFVDGFDTGNPEETPWRGPYTLRVTGP